MVGDFLCSFRARFRRIDLSIAANVRRAKVAREDFIVLRCDLRPHPRVWKTILIGEIFRDRNTTRIEIGLLPGSGSKSSAERSLARHLTLLLSLLVEPNLFLAGVPDRLLILGQELPLDFFATGQRLGDKTALINRAEIICFRPDSRRLRHRVGQSSLPSPAYVR